MPEQISFFPPVQSVELLSTEETPDERTTRVTLLISDSHGQFFSLFVRTARDFAESQHTPERAEDDTLEPAFVVARDSITPTDTDAILAMDPNFLAEYLVPQEVSND